MKGAVMGATKQKENISKAMELYAEEMLKNRPQMDVTINKDDLSCLLAATIEILDGLGESEYSLTWDSVYEKYGNAHTIEGRALASQRFFERNYDITAGAIHLTQSILHLLWGEWDRLTAIPPEK